MIPKQTPAEALESQINLAREAYANHQIHSYAHGHWTLRNPKSNSYWTEVVALAGGKLLVHGDMGPVIFGRYSPGALGYKDPNYDVYAANVVRWMGNRKRPDDGYFLEKARIGSECEGLIYEPDIDVFREELTKLIKSESEGEVDSDGEVDGTIRELRLALQEVLDGLGDEVSEIPEAQREIYDIFCDSERIPYGRSLTSGVVYAHAALQKLVSLFESDKYELVQNPTEQAMVEALTKTGVG